MRPAWLLFLPVALAACASLEPSAAGRDVRIVMRDPGSACRHLGDVTGSRGNF
ncbi:MAG: DUF4156 domain-containing protein, partial [Burkholderia sp.]|nr:DUF4156 domain-containing protein [Burkholderia sp.]